MIDFLIVSLTNGILIMLLIIVLILFCLYMYTDNQKLKQQNEELRKENRSLLETKIIKQDNIDSISIKSISNEQMPSNYNEIIEPTNLDIETNSLNTSSLPNKEEIIKEQDERIKNNIQPIESDNNCFTENSNIETSNLNYNNEQNKNLEIQKEQNNYNDTSFLETTNVEEQFVINKEISLIEKLIDSINTNQISNINDSTINKINDYSYYNLNETTTNNIFKDFDLNELIYKNNANKINEQIRIQDEYDYLKDISSKIVEELKPQTIKLTDYEQKQEDQAVISYKELVSIKDNNYITDDKQDTIKFIEELKSLRNSLK